MLRLIVIGLAIAMGIILAGPSNSQTNPGFNPDLSWCNVQGSLAIRGPAKWQCLQPGTAGQSLLSGGTGALPYWNTITGTGTVTSVNGSGGTTGLTISGGPITGAGTLTLGGFLDVSSGGIGVSGAVGAANTVLRSNGTIASWGQITGSNIAANAVTNASVSTTAGIAISKLAALPSLTVMANITGGSAVPTSPTVSQLLDAAFSNTQGTTLYRNVSGWSALPPGLNGQALLSGGTGANPSWQTIQGGNLGTQPNNTVLANISGSSATPTTPTVTQLLDSALGAIQGQVVYRGASGWTVLAPGTSGALLQTGGAAANPAWSTIGQIKGEPSTGSAASGNIGEHIASNIVYANRVALTSSGNYDVTSITLSAGDWDISALMNFAATTSTSLTYYQCSISTTSATQANDSPWIAANYGPTTALGAAWTFSVAITPTRVTLSTNTTYYAVCTANWSGGTGVFAYGQLRARRMR
jgi:hypothetical protein